RGRDPEVSAEATAAAAAAAGGGGLSAGTPTPSTVPAIGAAPPASPEAGWAGTVPARFTLGGWIPGELVGWAGAIGTPGELPLPRPCVDDAGTRTDAGGGTAETEIVPPDPAGFSGGGLDALPGRDR